jgi:CoA-transferase family III
VCCAADVDLTPAVLGDGPTGDGARRWAECGGMWLTGRPGGAHLGAPAGVIAGLDAAARALRRASAALGSTVEVDGPALLGERAALAGLGRGGTTSCGGATRLLRGLDGWLALSLPRPDDVELLPAWLGVLTAGTVPWEDVGTAVARRAVAELTATGAELGLAVATLGERRPGGAAVTATRLRGPAPPARRPLRVVDLSSLWAGPLCTHLLGAAGLEVIKVESTRRPDGARAGPPVFFDLLNAGKASFAVDFTAVDGRAALLRLLTTADVIVEASRPRALEQLGVDIATLAATGRLQVWASITAHGRSGAGRGRIGFGDDAAVAGGLIGIDDGGPTFLADAIADPATGLVAGAAILDRLRAGGRWLLDVALAGVAARLAVGERAGGDAPVAAPRARPPAGRAAACGADTARILAGLGDP